MAEIVKDAEMFADILDDGEQVIAVVRPNKKKFWNYFNWMMFWATWAWVIPMIAFMALMFYTDPDTSLHDANIIMIWTAPIGVGCILLTYIICVPLAKTTLTKRYYAYSNKRILIRCGIIGVNYAVLDYKLLGATTVSVGVLDRMMGGKTGQIRFGSASSPIVSMLSSNSLGFRGYIFAHVDKPYELLKEIKRIINIAQKD